jgi:hypothetical protein
VVLSTTAQRVPDPELPKDAPAYVVSPVPATGTGILALDMALLPTVHGRVHHCAEHVDLAQAVGRHRVLDDDPQSVGVQVRKRRRICSSSATSRSLPDHTDTAVRRPVAPSQESACTLRTKFAAQATQLGNTLRKHIAFATALFKAQQAGDGKLLGPCAGPARRIRV